MRCGLPGQSKFVSKNLALFLLGLCCLLLAGCQYWYKDMKGYLEYWSATLEVGEVQVQVEPENQVDSSGRTTISTNAAVVVSAVVENPDGHALNPGVGPASDILKSVRISGPAGSAALSRASVAVVGLTGIEMRLDPLSSVPTPESLRVEHKDFSVLLAPVRTETNMSPSEPKSLTFRYNTPPRMPLAVVESGGTLKFPDSATSWEVVSGSSQSDLDDLIFWAYPSGITDPTHPDCVASFRVTDGVDVEEQPASEYLMSREVDLRSLIPQDLVNAGYDVYCYLAINGGPVTVEAVDGEGVRGAGITSGALTAITLNSDGGTFGNGGGSVTVYRANGASLNGGDLDIPTKSGYYLSGWVTSAGAVTFPYTVSSSVTFTAQWTANPVSGGGSAPMPPPSVSWPNPVYVDSSNIDTFWNDIWDRHDQKGENDFTIVLQENISSTSLPISITGKDTANKLNVTITSGSGGPYTIDAKSSGRALEVKSNANVTLENIILTGGNGWPGGAVLVEHDSYSGYSATLTLKNGAVITGNTASGNGGGVAVQGTSSSLIMEGGEIRGNRATGNGGGVYMAQGGSLVMNGGMISDNSSGNGGGVYMESNTTLTMTGGTIEQNSSNTGGKGVHTNGTTTVNLGGSAVIAADNEIQLGSGTFITVTSTLSGSQPVATISPFKYNVGTQILEAGAGVALANESGKFAVVKDTYTTPGTTVEYFVDNTGTLQQQP